MARRAKFGQAYRVQPSLNSTLEAIAREMVAREDSNIMDAWRNGGEFDGKKVTDQMVLDYWKQREDGLDKTDPVYDTMQNQIEQLQYGIQQSEMDLKHLQGKVSDSQFAQFYLKWAKKAPRNSEWWRSLQKDAAQLMESAKGRSRQSADSAKADAFNKFQGSTYDSQIAIGNEMSAAMQKMSKETGLSLTDHGEELLRLVTQDYAAHPDEYHALSGAIKTADPNFSGAFTMQYFANAMNSATRGYDAIADRAHTDGYATAYASASKNQADMSWFATNTKAWPVATAYDRAYTKAMKTVNDPNASEMDRRAALAEFGNVAHTLANTPGLDTDVRVMLNADGDRALGIDVPDVPSFGPSMLGPSHPGIPAETGGVVKEMNDRAQAIKDAPDQWEYAPVGRDGHFDPSGKGAIGIVAQNEVPNDAVMVAVPGLDGTPHMVSIQPKTVYMEDPNNPTTGNTENGAAVGRSITYAVGGKTVTLYETGDSTGATRWSESSPFNANLKQTTDEQGNMHLVADVPSASPAQRAQAIYAQAQQIDKDHGTSIADSLVTRDATGAIDGLAVSKASSFGKAGGAEQGATGGVTVTFDDKGFHVTTNNSAYADGKVVSGGSITQDFTFAGQASDPGWLYNTAHDQTRFTAGDIPGTTFNSPMGASTNAFGSSLTTPQLKSLINDPEFQHAWIVQENAALGITNPLMDTRGYNAFAAFKADVMGRPDTAPAGYVPAPGTAGYHGRPTPGGHTRTDLNYPGGTAQGVTGADVPGITFAGQTIRVPTIPQIGGAVAADGEPMGAGGLMPGAWKNSVLQPGAQPGVPATTPTTTPTFTQKIGSPLVTSTPTATTPGATPTATVPGATAPGNAYASTTKAKQLERLG